MTSHYYIIGLGNPDEKYRDTPHNVGFQVLDVLRRVWQGTDWKRDNTLNAVTSRCESSGASFLLIKPETYMNRSGDTVRKLIKQDEGEDEEDRGEGRDERVIGRFLVVHDDIDLPRGSLRITRRGGAGGHRGVSSVAQALGTDEFVRFKIGIAPVDENGEMRKPQRTVDGEAAVSEYVLKPQPAFAREIQEEIAPVIAEAMGVLVREGVDVAMNKYN
ncbi:MAG: aminoacyl-tRNA hydrolase [Candidatus Paceibacterota bacterium]